MRKTIWVIISAVLVILISGVAYFLNFKNQNISHETSTWGAFSDYINAFVSIANLIVFIWLSLEVFNYNRKKDLENESFQKAIEKPILILNSIPPSSKGSVELWQIKNIGNGAALNLRLAESHSREIQWITPVTKCYSLGKGDVLPLSWLQYANVICVTYEDIFGHKYVTIGADDESYIQPLNKDYKTIDISGRTFEKVDFIDFMNFATRRLHAASISSFITTTTTSETTNP